jgi:hypothetical protein
LSPFRTGFSPPNAGLPMHAAPRLVNRDSLRTLKEMLEMRRAW